MFRNKIEEMKMHLERNGLISFGRGEIVIDCIRGTLWVTWPGSGDVILREGEELTVRQHGRLCITSMNGAFISVRRKKIFPCIKSIPRIIMNKALALLMSCIRSGVGQSAFGDSVHSITR